MRQAHTLRCPPYVCFSDVCARNKGTYVTIAVRFLFGCVTCKKVSRVLLLQRPESHGLCWLIRALLLAELRCMRVEGGEATMQAARWNADVACASPVLAARACRGLRPFRCGRRPGRLAPRVLAQYNDDRYITGTPE